MCWTSDKYSSEDGRGPAERFTELHPQLFFAILAAQVCTPYRESDTCADDLLLWSQHQVKSLQNYLTRRWCGAWIKNFTDFVAARNATSFSFLRRLNRFSGFPGVWKGKGDASTLLWKYFLFFAAASSSDEGWQNKKSPEDLRWFPIADGLLHSWIFFRWLRHNIMSCWKRMLFPYTF